LVHKPKNPPSPGHWFASHVIPIAVLSKLLSIEAPRRRNALAAEFQRPSDELSDNLVGFFLNLQSLRSGR